MNRYKAYKITSSFFISDSIHHFCFHGSVINPPGVLIMNCPEVPSAYLTGVQSVQKSKHTHTPTHAFWSKQRFKSGPFILVPVVDLVRKSAGRILMLANFMTDEGIQPALVLVFSSVYYFPLGMASLMIEVTDVAGILIFCTLPYQLFSSIFPFVKC